MNRVREIIIFSFIAVFFTSTLAWAAWSNPVLRASKTIQTSGGVIRLSTQKTVEKVVARTLIKRGIIAAGAAGACIAGSEIVGLAALALGVYYLVTDYEALVNWFKTQDIFSGTPDDTLTLNWADGSQTVCRKVQKSTGNLATGSDLNEGLRLSVNLGSHAAIWSGRNYHYYATGTPFIVFEVYINGVKQQNDIVVATDTVEVVYTGTGTQPTQTETDNRPLDDSKIDSLLEQYPEYWTDPAKAQTTIQETLPDGAYDLGPSVGSTTESPLTDPNTGAKEDPLTGQPQDEVENIDNPLDKMNVPGQAAIPALDTSIVAPEQSDIGQLISGWMDNAPFMGIIGAMEVTGSGSGIFTVPLPFGEGSATMDFTEWSFLWSIIATIVISISYIYGAMIIFGGKT